MINAQKAKSTSMVMYIPSPPLGMKLRERLQNMKRYFPDEFHKESNRTVWPPFRVVGSPYLSYHFLQRLSRPIKKYGIGYWFIKPYAVFVFRVWNGTHILFILPLCQRLVNPFSKNLFRKSHFYIMCTNCTPEFLHFVMQKHQKPSCNNRKNIV